ncbi:MAG: STAS domain-containing protein [Acidobacteriota bacterium]|nr:STAS domain-containing protein [Acidobacteriota bacterium]
MQIHLRKVQDVAIVAPKGRLVAGVGDEALHRVLHELLEGDWQKILLDLKEVSYIDSSGIGELVDGLRSAQALGVAIKATPMAEKVERVLRLSQILPLMDVAPDEATALRAFGVDPAALETEPEGEVVEEPAG